MVVRDNVEVEVDVDVKDVKDDVKDVKKKSEIVNSGSQTQDGVVSWLIPSSLSPFLSG